MIPSATPAPLPTQQAPWPASAPLISQHDAYHYGLAGPSHGPPPQPALMAPPPPPPRPTYVRPTLQPRRGPLTQYPRAQEQPQGDWLPHRYGYVPAGSEHDETVVPPPRRRNHHGPKVIFPTFTGTSDPEAFYEWELKAEQVFDYYGLGEEERVTLATIHFTEFALLWWNDEKESRESNLDPPLDTWTALREAMRRRFVPSNYKQQVHQKLELLLQGDRTPDDYYKELCHLLVRSGLRLPEEYIQSKFTSGLNEEIRTPVKLQRFESIHDALHYATQIYDALPKKKELNQPKKWELPRAKEKESAREEPTTKGPDVRTRDIKCYKCMGRGHMARDCPSRKQVLMTSLGEYESAGEEEQEEEELRVYAAQGECFMISRCLDPSGYEPAWGQREQAFYHYVTIEDVPGVYVALVDSGSDKNLISQSLVSELNLSFAPKVEPYVISWIDAEHRVLVEWVALVKFTLGTCKDYDIFDVTTLTTCDLILGRPWQFDREMIYEARPNVIHFSKEESGWQARYSLTSMSMADLMEYREKRKQREASSSQTPNLRQWYDEFQSRKEELRIRGRIFFKEGRMM